MKKQEIESITKKMAEKQTWVRKSLDDFLEEWERITETDLSGYERFVLYEYEVDGYKKRLVLRRGIAEVDGDSKDPYCEEWNNFGSYLCLEGQPISRIRKIITHIADGIIGYFENIQNGIDAMSEDGKRIAEITEKLK